MSRCASGFPSAAAPFVRGPPARPDIVTGRCIEALYRMYRFVFAVASDPEMRRPLPRAKRVSTRFQLEPWEPASQPPDEHHERPDPRPRPVAQTPRRR